MTSGETSPGSHATSGPYQGIRPFTGADTELFFGRDAESEQLVAKIRGSDWSILHASSGSGKSSLLAAKVIPDLETEGYSVAVATPEADPLAHLKDAILEWLLPAIEREGEVLAALRELLGDEITLEQARRRFREAVDDTLARRERLAAWLREEDVTHRQAAPIPMIARLLRGSLTAVQLVEHLKAISNRPLVLAPGSTLGELGALVADGSLEEDWRRLRQWIAGDGASEDAGEEGLRPFLVRLFDFYGAGRGGFSLVLIYDQFEELFTRFRDVDPIGKEAGSGAEAVVAWKKRQRLLDALRELAVALLDGGQRARLPFKLLFTLRSEFLGDLEPIKSFVPQLGSSRNTMRLERLQGDGARAAIVLPAERAGYTLGTGSASTIVEALTSEAGFISPIHVQIVGERIWEEKTDGSSVLAPGPLDVEQVQGWIKDHFDRVLARLRDGEKEEAVEMLTRLLTAENYRLPVLEDQVVPSTTGEDRHLAPLRRRLLDEVLTRNGWVKYFEVDRKRSVVIEHEWLAAKIRKAEAELDLEAFRRAAKNLGAAESDVRAPPLSADELRMLYRQRLRVDGEAAVSEHLLRSALLADWTVPGREARDLALPRFVEWIEERLGELKRDEVLAQAGEKRLTGAELDLLRRDPSWTADELSTRALGGILSSHVLAGGEAGEDEVAAWARLWARRVLGDPRPRSAGSRST